MKLSQVLSLPVVLASLLAPTPVVAEHTSNWAVLVSTSRFWFNYRHLANVLSLYRTVKRLGIPDSQIILMLPDDMACNPRNAFPGTVYSNADRAVDLYGDNIEVDYRGYEVTVENFIRLLTDRVGEEMPRSKRLLTDDRSNILVYMTGHGGNEFLKFQDAEEISAFDLADAFEQMWEKKRYHELLFMIDTCQANTMYSKFYSPNIIATGSSEIDQSSYSHHADNDVGVAVIDRYTYYNLDFLETQVREPSSKQTLGDLFDSYDESKIHSHPGVRWDLFPGGGQGGRERLVMDFFGNVQNVEVDSVGNDTEWKEDLLLLGKKIAELRERADAQDAAAKNQSNTELPTDSHTTRRIRAAKVEADDRWWGKKVIGAWALAGCTLVWLAGSYIDSLPAMTLCPYCHDINFEGDGSYWLLDAVPLALSVEKGCLGCKFFLQSAEARYDQELVSSYLIKEGIKVFLKRHEFLSDFAASMDMNLAASWLEKCSKHHEGLCRPLNDVLLQSRLVHIPRNCDERLQLRVTEGLTGRLGFEYLWVDTLCIIQGDTEDWAHESSQMSQVHSDASLTLAADLANSGDVDIFRPQKTLRSHSFGPMQEYRLQNRAVKNERGWAWQERLLSSRTLHFLDAQLAWECPTTIYLEEIRGRQIRQEFHFATAKFEKFLRRQPSTPSRRRNFYRGTRNQKSMAH
ncbi:hypothetical protein G7Y89_g4794 [Cudoniella acicularis]|uniref:Heterokaryon incompatibility domain-containing protein n=1 Tax=Cudoniella acicularis TaxID=354080 RepID=A0A8H4RQX4_9HELO|nr:hypothetical protein G7Y89_g4794 [Cudoniella acicularis]